MEMRTELELLKLLRGKANFYFFNNLNIGICMVVHFMSNKGEINLAECFSLHRILRQNWHLSKHPMGIYKFDTMQERLDFLDMLIEKYDGVRKD